MTPARWTISSVPTPGVPALGEQLARRRDERRARRLGLSHLDFHTTCMLDTYRLYVKEAFMKHEVHLPQGTIRYREDGTGEPLLFVHGVLVNGDLWRKVVPRLAKDFRCIVPDWPFGSHEIPLAADADLSPPGTRADGHRLHGCARARDRHARGQRHRRRDLPARRRGASRARLAPRADLVRPLRPVPAAASSSRSAMSRRSRARSG